MTVDVFGPGGAVDVVDRAARVLGRVVVDEMPEVEVKNDAGSPVPVVGAVAVSNLPATQPVSGPLTDTQLRAGKVAVRDDYQTGEVLPDQTGAGGVLTFTFASAVHLVVVDANGAAADVARADPFGGTPDAATGIPCRDETPTFMPVTTSAVEVFAPAGMTVSCYGYRRV